ncbi:MULTISPECIES: L,D-transpeptidase family protein [unclassified Sphingomonas]|uniref:L,D-transpeptidase family protein n=1 Tax=unclassified Sphingomonas TaxID=196159 RepID=UPI0009EC801D|nr:MULTISPECIES: L,D-transpeptidase family protein [unclassified Sphingomonas]
MKAITDHRLCFARALRRALFAGAGLTLANVASAQVLPPPVVPTVPMAAPMVQPILAPLPLPTLTAAQESELARLLARDAVAQGLKDREPLLGALSGPALVQAALDHAHAVRAGRLDTADFQKDWAMRPQSYDPLPAFRDAVAKDRLAAWVASLPPPYAGYDTLVAGLARYRKIAANGGWPIVAAGSDLRMGGRGPQVAALRKRLAVEDSELSASGDSFDPALLDAVRRAQRRYGLNPAGQVGAQTIASLNVPVGERIKQIKANMERWRWLPTELEKNRIQVNIAAAVLTVFDGDQPVTSMKAVTGRPGDETPMLTSTIHSIVLNPPWNVPSSIADKELWPKERANPGYLKRNGFRVIETEGGGRRLQQASERSALGRFKFDFDNPFAVYLHDTPAQSGFANFDRLASHGCVRLEKPEDLARLLLRTTPDWSAGQIDTTLASGKTVRARVADPVKVYLLYWTAFATPNGTMSFREDPYKWDGVLANKIAARAEASQLAAR